MDGAGMDGAGMDGAGMDEAGMDGAGMDGAGTTAGESLRTRMARRAAARNERSFVMVWLGLLLLLLMGVAGLSVDLSNWWLQAEKLQRAVDAGAHAGAVFLPGNVPQAKVKARTETARNGFNDGILAGEDNVDLVVTQLANPYRLRVKGTTMVDNHFIALLGFNQQQIMREAVGEFEVPVAMGSPENKIGNDPEEGDNDSQFWINVAGPGSTKDSGDRYQSKNCSSSYGNCTGTKNAGINNDDYSFDGYFFTLDVKSVDPGKDLIVQVFDAAMTYVGDFCGNATFPTGAQLTTLQGLPGNPYPDATTRYVGGNGVWCTGDQRINSGQDTQTTFILREPDDTPWSDTDNPVISTATCSPQRMPAFDASSSSTYIYTRLHPSDGVADSQAVVNPGDGVWTFAETFRKWATICYIPAGSVEVGEYLLQVRSNANTASPTAYDSSIAQKGHNRMAMRVGFGLGGLQAIDGSYVSIAARGKLPIYANADAADTKFHLARITPADAGRTLRVTLWDMGDASAAGTLRILAPEESGSSFADCTFKRDNGGTLSVSSNCKLNNVSSGTGFNGRLVDVDVPIPEDYDCDDDLPTGCWTKVQATFPSNVNDTTTWSASILGSPVRLVE